MTFNNDNDIRKFLTQYDVSKIFCNKENAIDFLLLTIDSNYKELNKKKSEVIYQLIIDNWDYNKALPIIRDMAFNKKYDDIKYNYNKNLYKKTCSNLVNRFGPNNNWSFNPFDYDGHMTRFIRNSEDILNDTDTYIELVVKNLWVKSLNMYRSFLFEYFIIKNKKDILPTLGNKSLTDFYYLGKSRDQKNSKSVTREFEKDYGPNWKQIALSNPELVAKYLYTNQGEGRFGFEPRLFIINLKDEHQTVEEIEEISKNINFGKSLPIDFEYKGVEYKTDAIVIYI